MEEKKTSMIICPNCSAENVKGSDFCSNCGTKLEALQRCSHCGEKVPEKAVFCPMCGKNLKEESGILSGSIVSGNVALDNTMTIDLSKYDEATIQLLKQILDGKTATNKNILSGSAVAGDVALDASTKISIDNSTKQIINQTFNDSAIKCHACEKMLIKGSSDSHKCAQCGDIYCSEHFKKGSHLCVNCFETAVGLLKTKSFSSAKPYFEKAIADGASDPDIYYYLSICLLDGKRAFVQQRTTIDKILKLMDDAVAKEAKAIYYYFIAYIKYDYFEKKYLNIDPNYRKCYQLAVSHGVSEADIREMYSILSITRPMGL